MCLFNVFRCLAIKNNRIINWFAASALSIYLVSDCAYFREILYGYIAKIYDNVSYIHTLARIV